MGSDSIDRIWYINTKLRYNTRDYNDGYSSIAIRPSISIENKLNKSLQFEMELTYKDKETEIPDSATFNEKRKLFYTGYIFTF